MNYGRFFDMNLFNSSAIGLSDKTPAKINHVENIVDSLLEAAISSYIYTSYQGLTVETISVVGFEMNSFLAFFTINVGSLILANYTKQYIPDILNKSINRLGLGAYKGIIIKSLFSTLGSYALTDVYTESYVDILILFAINSLSSIGYEMIKDPIVKMIQNN